MNENIVAARKYRKISQVISSVFIIFLILISFIFSYFYDNYWLLFAMVFGMIFNQFSKIFYVLTVVIIVYWFSKGFKINDEFTFYWILSLMGCVARIFVQAYEDTSKLILEEHISSKTKPIFENAKKMLLERNRLIEQSDVNKKQQNEN